MEETLTSEGVFNQVKDLLEEGIGLAEARKIVGLYYREYAKLLSKSQKIELNRLSYIFKKTGSDIFKNEMSSCFRTLEEEKIRSDWPDKLKGVPFKPGENKTHIKENPIPLEIEIESPPISLLDEDIPSCANIITLGEL